MLLRKRRYWLLGLLLPELLGEQQEQLRLSQPPVKRYTAFMVEILLLKAHLGHQLIQERSRILGT
jgi:hypothetical protein